MKKFFTLCAAFATMLSVEAVPQFVKKANVAEFKPVLGRQISEHIGKKPAKVAETTLKQHGMQVSLAKANRAKAEAFEYTYDEVSLTGYEEDTWFNLTTTDQAYIFYFDILCPVFDLEVGKVYTMADCDPSFTYLSNNTTYSMTKFEDVAIEFSWADDMMVLEANCTTVDGDTYHLYYKPLEYPESFTEVAVGQLDMRFKNFTETMGVFQFTGENDTYDLGISIASDGQIEGSYTTENVYEGLNNYTYLNMGTKVIKLCDVEMQVASLGGNNYHIDAKMYAYDGNVYTVNQDYIEPTPQNTADLTATNLKLDDSMFDLYMMFYGYGMYEITASNSNYTINGTLLTYTDIPGHYIDADHKINYLYITDAEGNKTSIFSGDFDVEQTEGSWTIKGKMLGWNNTEYNVDLSFAIPDITGEASFTAVDGELYDFCGQLGAFQVWAVDEAQENEFSIVLNASEVATGKYNEPSKEYESYCSIMTGEGPRQIYNCDFDLTVDTDAAVFTLTGTCQADELLYTINISGTYFPEEKERDPYDATEEDGEVDVAFGLEDITEFAISAEEGYAYLSVENVERMDAWACMIFVDGDELPAGEYPFTETYEPGTAQTGLIWNNNLYPTMYFQFDEDGYVTLPVWYCTTGSVTVDYDEEGNIVMDCEALNSNGVRVHVTVNAQDPVGIKEVAAKAQMDGKFYEQNAIVIRSNGNTYNTFGQLTK